MLTLAIVAVFLCCGVLLIRAFARRRRPGPGGNLGETAGGRLARIRKAGL